MEKHDIPAENVVHHSDWTPGRKFDPSFYWSIESFAKNGCQVYSFNYQNFSQSQIQDFNNKVKQECGFGCLNEESQFKLSFLVSLKQYWYNIPYGDLNDFVLNFCFNESVEGAIVSYKIKFCGDDSYFQDESNVAKLYSFDKDAIDRLLTIEKDDLKNVLSIIDYVENYDQESQEKFWHDLASQRDYMMASILEVDGGLVYAGAIAGCE